MLDVGVGSGAIALAIADEHPGARVTGIDTSPDALALARENAEALGLAVRLEERDGADLGADEWDLVVANPPYVDPAEIDTLEPEVRDWEPRAALVGPGTTERIARAALRRAQARRPPRARGRRRAGRRRRGRGSPGSGTRRSRRVPDLDGPAARGRGAPPGRRRRGRRSAACRPAGDPRRPTRSTGCMRAPDEEAVRRLYAVKGRRDGAADGAARRGTSTRWSSSSRSSPAKPRRSCARCYPGRSRSLCRTRRGGCPGSRAATATRSAARARSAGAARRRARLACRR